MDKHKIFFHILQLMYKTVQTLVIFKFYFLSILVLLIITMQFFYFSVYILLLIIYNKYSVMFWGSFRDYFGNNVFFIVC